MYNRLFHRINGIDYRLATAGLCNGSFQGGLYNAIDYCITYLYSQWRRLLAIDMAPGGISMM